MNSPDYDLEFRRQSCACKSVTLLTKPKFSLLSWMFANKKKRRRFSGHPVPSEESCCMCRSCHLRSSNHSSTNSSVRSRLYSSANRLDTWQVGSSMQLSTRSSSVSSRQYSSANRLEYWEVGPSRQPARKSLFDNFLDLFGSQVSEIVIN